MNPVPPVSGEWASSFDPPVSHIRPEPTQPEPPKQPARLSIVLPFIERDIPQIIRLLKWCFTLSGTQKRTLFLLPFKGIDPLGDVRTYADFAFSDVHIIKDYEGVTSDWKADDKIRDAAGPNSMFRQAAWYFHLNPALGPWLYLEPDCVPLTKTWADEIETAYLACGKPFMGARMKSQSGDEYLNGAAVYHRNTVGLAPGIVTRTTWQFPDSRFTGMPQPEMETAFDIAGGDDVFRRAHITDLIQLGYRSDKLPEIAKGAVLFHGDRSGKLLDNLSGVPHGTKPLDGQTVSRRTHIPKLRVRLPLQQPNGNGAAPTVGDQLRQKCDELEALIEGHPNRKVRLLKELRKRRIAPPGMKR